MKRRPSTFYGFWEYDIFPGVVGGKIHSPCGSEYPGVGYWAWDNTGAFVKPFVVVSLTEGKKIQRRIDALKAAFFADQALLYKRYAKERDAIIEVPK